MRHRLATDDDDRHVPTCEHCELVNVMEVAQALTTKGPIQVTNKYLCALVEEQLHTPDSSSIGAHVPVLPSAVQLCTGG
jgi:hypothetical protein